MILAGWLGLIAALSLIILALASVFALLGAGKALRQRRAAGAAASVRHTFAAERELWLNCLTDREMTAALATRLTFTPDFLGPAQLKAENAIRILLILRHYESIHQHYLLDQLTPDAWEASRKEMQNTFRDRRSRAVFEKASDLFSAGFSAFAGRELLP